MSNFHCSRLICHVPSPNVKMGIRPSTNTNGRARVLYCDGWVRGAAVAFWRAELVNAEEERGIGGGTLLVKVAAVCLQHGRSRGNMVARCRTGQRQT